MVLIELFILLYTEDHKKRLPKREYCLTRAPAEHDVAVGIETCPKIA
jgi:hypothetical protein